MRKIYVILIALVCSICCIVAIDCGVKNKLNKNLYKLQYYNFDERNSSDYVMDSIITENSMVVLGSSELSATSKNIPAYPSTLFNDGYSDYNMVLIGRGNMQSIHDAVTLGALSDNIKNGKVVLIVSPQWFTESHLSSEMYASRFEESMFVEFLKNNEISKKTKIAVSERINYLLTADPIELNRVQNYENIYLYHNMNPAVWIEMNTNSLFRDAKLRFTLATKVDDITPSIDYGNYVNVENINFKDLLVKAEEIGKTECTNNEYGVYDDYFDKYISGRYESLAGSNAESSYTTSIEYDDLRLFLDVCNELDIEPLIVSVPVNGRWYDYTGFPKWNRNQYYQNIRDICAEYNAKIADFSEKEYEMYFLKDIMHMGWKGWVYLDEAVYKFYNDEEVKVEDEYEEVIMKNTTLSPGAIAVENNKYELITNVTDNNFNAVILQMNESESEKLLTIMDIAYGIGKRTGIYYHTGKSGNYVIRLRGNTNLQDEYVENTLYLENGGVYKFTYKVNSLESRFASFENLTLLKIL